MNQWISDHEELAAVARMLIDVGTLRGAGEVVDFVERPWRWGRERDAWVTAGRPVPGYSAWALFALRLERIE